MRDIKELQVWKEDCLTSLSFYDMDEFDEALFIFNRKREKINELYLNLDDWIDPDTDRRLSKIALDNEDVIFSE